jgi:hypothetical protein
MRLSRLDFDNNVGAAMREKTIDLKRSPTGVVVAVHPIVLSEHDAAIFIGRPPRWMRERRLRDIAVVRLGKEPEGPPWVEVSGAIFYRVSDLSAWLESKAIERGDIEWRGEARTTIFAPSEEPNP